MISLNVIILAQNLLCGGSALGKFEKVLIASDFDGTLKNDDGIITDDVRSAIAYFISEGGYFTVCTGRTYQGFHLYDPSYINAPVLLTNGSMAYDYEKNEPVFVNGIDAEHGIPFVRAIMEKFPDVSIEMYPFDSTYAIHLDDTSHRHFTSQGIDFDTHTDHRGVSISFEKAMERILKKESGYTPKVLKCFGYSLAWKSKPDFYALNIKSTVMQDREKNNDPSYETDVPQYRWNNRVRLPIDKKSLSHSILRCSEYKALSEHLSQYAYCYSERIINGDSVYWNRRTDSLTYNADISVSSGDASLLNDFRLIGVGNRTAGLHVKLENCVSRFDKNDAQKTVTVKFDSPKTVSCVSLYDNFGLNSNILGGVITFSDGSKVEVPALNADGSETRVVFEPKHNITSFTFKVTEYEGVAGLDEIEAFENADYDMGFSLIKLKNADTDDYIYNYLITPDEKSLNLGVYLSNPNAGYTIKIIEGDSVKLEGNTLVFDDDFEKCTVRAELNGDPSTYAQIIVKRLSERELKSYESFEKVNKTVFKIDTLRLKMKNLFVNGYVYEELNDFVKSLEKKAGIEISE